MANKPELTIILPACNEAPSLRRLLPALKAGFPTAEILVVDDGSTDDTAALCAEHGVRREAHRTRLGNGAAVKTGARKAQADTLAFMDADSQHDPAELRKLLECHARGADMVVGARTAEGQAGIGRRVANGFYNRFASWMTGRPILDLTSGFRVASARQFREFLHLLPNGFSYPTTITMAFLRAGYGVEYVPITVHRRIGKSHIRIVHDGIRFLLIIFKVGTLYSPLKIFLPVSASFFLVGLCYYLFTYVTTGRFTNMSALLFINSILIFLIGLVSEQITALTFQRSNDRPQ